MKDTNGAQAATDEHPDAPKVAPRFTRAVNAERSRLEGKRAQLLLKREAAQAELGGSIDLCRQPMSCSSCSRRCSPPTATNPRRQVGTAARRLTPAHQPWNSPRRVRAITHSTDRSRRGRDRSLERRPSTNQRRSEKR